MTDENTLDSTLDLVEPSSVVEQAALLACSHADHERLDHVRGWADGFWAMRVNARRTIGYAVVPPHQESSLKHAYVAAFDGVDVSRWWIDIARLVGSQLDMLDWQDSAWLTRTRRTVALTRIGMSQLRLLPAMCTPVCGPAPRSTRPPSVPVADGLRRRRSDQ